MLSSKQINNFMNNTLNKENRECKVTGCFYEVNETGFCKVHDYIANAAKESNKNTIQAKENIVEYKNDELVDVRERYRAGELIEVIANGIKIFPPQPTEEQANFMQVGDTHCFGCHKTFSPNSNHQGTCEGLKKPYESCKWDGKVCFPFQEDSSESWEKQFDKMISPVLKIGYPNSPNLACQLKIELKEFIKKEKEKSYNQGVLDERKRIIENK